MARRGYLRFIPLGLLTGKRKIPTINAFHHGCDTTLPVHTCFITDIYRLFQLLPVARSVDVG